MFSSADLRRHVLGLAGRWFEITYAQLAIALLVAILGIANALTVSIADRRRELGILRAVGGLRRQVRIAVWMEAAAVAVVGFVLGLGVQRGEHLLCALDLLRPRTRIPLPRPARRGASADAGGRRAGRGHHAGRGRRPRSAGLRIGIRVS